MLRIKKKINFIVKIRIKMQYLQKKKMRKDPYLFLDLKKLKEIYKQKK